jgi:hypothetical protein
MSYTKCSLTAHLTLLISFGEEKTIPKYKYADVTYYCGRVQRVPVGGSKKCECGVTLHVQQKKGGGRWWGTLPNSKKEHRRKLLKRI